MSVSGDGESSKTEDEFGGIFIIGSKSEVDEESRRQKTYLFYHLSCTIPDFIYLASLARSRSKVAPAR